MTRPGERTADEDEERAHEVGQRPATEGEIRQAEAPPAPPTASPPSVRRKRRFWQFWRREED